VRFESREHLIGAADIFSKVKARASSGYAMVGLLVALGVMGIMMSVLLPFWSQAARREREAELVFRGEQYARAIELYQRQYVGAYPPDFETLVEQRFLRRLYADPMTEDGEFRVIYRSQVEDLLGAPEGEAGSEETTEADPIRFDRDREEGGVVGVVSRNDGESLRKYNGRERYNEWAFIYVTSSSTPGGEAGGEDRGRFNLGSQRREMSHPESPGSQQRTR